MCLGIPLRISEVVSDNLALCESGESTRQVNTGLLDAPPRVGEWLLVHVDIAIRSLAELEARQVRDALEAVTAAAASQPFEHLLGDLIDREPELPEHLRPSERREQHYG